MLLYHVQVRDELVAAMAERRIALTTDMWTSVAGQGYITVTAHYLTDQWKMCCKMLATRVVKDQHTGVHLAGAMKKLQEEFCIKEVVSITTDNAANMKVMAKEGNFQRVPCFSHTLQLAVNDALRDERLQKCFAVCKRLVSIMCLIAISQSMIYDFFPVHIIMSS